MKMAKKLADLVLIRPAMFFSTQIPDACSLAVG
jgi:hypothetical protein